MIAINCTIVLHQFPVLFCVRVCVCVIFVVIFVCFLKQTLFIISEQTWQWIQITNVLVTVNNQYVNMLNSINDSGFK